MFTHIGRKIKMYAKVICWIGIGFSVLSGLFMIIVGCLAANNPGVMILSILMGLMTMILGSLLSWISSFMTYGFGELVDKTSNIEEKICGTPADNSAEANY